jgi:hypothetical protein
MKQNAHNLNVRLGENLSINKYFQTPEICFVPKPGQITIILMKVTTIMGLEGKKDSVCGGGVSIGGEILYCGLERIEYVTYICVETA